MERLRVWTVQPAGVVSALLNAGQVQVDPGCLVFIPPAYRWLRQQLRLRLEGYGNRFPWWVYCHRPAMRNLRRFQPGQTLLELKVPTQNLVTFPIRAWHQVYCGLALPLQHGDKQKFSRREIRTSWENLFHPELSGYGRGREGVMETLRLDQLCRVDEVPAASASNF